MSGRRRQRALAIVTTVLASLLSGAAVSAPAKDNDLAAWDAKWIQIQSAADHTDWIDHFRVCAIKFRYRNYDQLFRCLELFEAKVAKVGVKVKHGNVGMLRKAAPVLTGWMRAAAYTELGEPEQALHWAESAWAALPEARSTVCCAGVQVVEESAASTGERAVFKAGAAVRQGPAAVGGLGGNTGTVSTIARRCIWS